MNNLSFFHLMICLFIISKKALLLPAGIKEKASQQEESIPKNFIPESNVAEESSEEQPVFIMLPVLGDRQRRGIYDANNMINFENVSYDVPSYIKFNESSKGDIEVSLIPSPETQQQRIGTGGTIGTGNGGPNANCCPIFQKPNLPNSQPPICLTIALDNIFPAGKAGKIVISNSSEIRGSGAILKVSFMESKTTTCPGDIFGNFDSSSTKERMEVQKKKKVDEEDEEEDEGTTQVLDQKSLQEIILKILAGNKTSSSTVPSEDLIYLDNSTGEPSFTFLINPSLFHKISGKHGVFSTTGNPSTYRNLNPPDFDSLLKTVEHMTSTIPKEKLLTLLSNLINKATLNKEVSSNQ